MSRIGIKLVTCVYTVAVGERFGEREKTWTPVQFVTKNDHHSGKTLLIVNYFSNTFFTITLTLVTTAPALVTNASTLVTTASTLITNASVVLTIA